jgi:hypothetical protein
VALGQLFVRNGETLKDAIRRDNDEAPFGRCGDQEKSGDFPGCGTPLVNNDWYVCDNFPDCSRP